MILSGKLWTLHVGDVMNVLDSLPAESVHCAVTSPPYWGLRDYKIPPSVWPDGWVGCFGSEPTIERYVENSVTICRKIRRVLRSDAALWWNLGDSYCSTDKWGGGGGNTGKHVVADTGDVPSWQVRERKEHQPGLKPGDQCLIPFRVALALQADGWYVRSTVVWSKRSPMPESVGGWRWVRCRVKVREGGTERWPEHGSQGAWKDGTHFLNPGTLAKWTPCPGCRKCSPNGGYVLRKGRWRCTNAWEPIFQLAKSPEYFADAEGVKEKAVGDAPGNKTHKAAQAYEAGDRKHRTAAGLTQMVASETRNPRNVWNISSEPLKSAHFAAFPSIIPRKCITASTSAAGCCPSCGNQWAPIIETERVPTRPGTDSKVTGDVMNDGNRDPERHIQRTKVLGYRQTCNCPEHEPVPCTVLDPFAGSGTTVMVARQMGRQGIGIEISETYAKEIAVGRIETPLVIGKPVKKRKRSSRERLLF